MKYTCLIIDDEQPARELLGRYIDKLPNLVLVKACKSAMEALEIINSEPIDLIFLDIQMPDLTGLDMIKGMRSQPATIFTTAYQEFALDAYALDAVDYLLKPFPFNRFVQAVNKASELIDLRKGSNNVEQQPAAPETLVIKAEHKLYRVEVSKIKYIEGLREYVTYHLTDKKIISLEALKTIETKLKDHGFVRVHKSFIVNKKWVELMDGNKLKIGDREIPVGTSFKEQAIKGIF